VSSQLQTRRGRRWGDQIVRGILFLCAFVSVVTTAAIIWILVREAWTFFREVSPLAFLFGTRWAPLLEPRSFGVLPLVCGTALVVAGAALVSLPLGLASGIFLSEYASERTRGILKPVLEILAGVPTVVYGYFALTFITPLLMRVFPEAQVFNAASAAIVVGVMILPMVASLCDDSLRAVPRALRDAGYALGATDFEVSLEVVVPGALSGVLAYFVRALSRAIGETVPLIMIGALTYVSFTPRAPMDAFTALPIQMFNWASRP